MIDFLECIFGWAILLAAAALTIAFPLPMIGLWVMFYVLSRL
jgi:uncharacterized membrane protein